MSTRAFLDRLYSACNDGVVELRAFPSGAREWTNLGQWSALGTFVTTQVRAGQNIGLGVATRRDATSGTGANLLELPALFCDLDKSPEKARRRLDLLPFRPSWIVRSGDHVHAYWLTKEPTNLLDAIERTRAIALERRLAQYLDGDQQATDLARVLRLPGTLNFKHAEPRPVTVLEQHDTAINLSELDDFLPGEIVRHGELVPENRLREGYRNDALHGLVRSLRWRGLPMRVVSRVLDVVNAEWCDPPLPAPELSTLLQHAMIARDRPDFVARHRPDDIVHDAAPANGVKPCR